MKYYKDISFLKSRFSAREDAVHTQILEPEMIEDDPDLTMDDICLDSDPDVADSELLAAVMLQTSGVGSQAKPAPRQAEPAAGVPQGEAGITWSLPGFEGKCRVHTNFGELPIEALRRRDMVRTISGAYREVQWVDAIRLDAEFISRHPEALPVMIRAKAMGNGYPIQNMLVSPGQKICDNVQSPGRGQTRAAQLDGRPGFLRQRRSEVTYYRFHCGGPEMVCIEGSYFCLSPED